MLQGDSNPDPQNQSELKVYASVHWTTSVNGDFFGFFYFPVELNLSLTKAKRKAHNKPINTLLGLVPAGERL